MCNDPIKAGSKGGFTPLILRGDCSTSRQCGRTRVTDISAVQGIFLAVWLLCGAIKSVTLYVAWLCGLGLISPSLLCAALSLGSSRGISPVATGDPYAGGGSFLSSDRKDQKEQPEGSALALPRRKSGRRYAPRRTFDGS